MPRLLCILTLAVLASVCASAVSSDDCRPFLNRLALFTLNTLDSAEEIALTDISCSIVSDINVLDNDLMFVTPGRVGDENIVCMSDDLSSPCVIQIGTFLDQSDPNLVLSEAFDFKQEIDLTQPLEESLERLFIRPSKVLRKSSAHK